MKKFIPYYIPVLFWLIFIFTFPLIIQTGKFQNTPIPLDKIVHIVEFGVLGFLFVRAFYYGMNNPDIKRAFLLTIGVAVFLAGADELHQIYFSDRFSSFYDFIADVFGITCSQILFWFFIKYKNTPE